MARTPLPSFAVAVIRTLPFLTPVTVPFASTVAMPSLEEAQDTVFSCASSGVKTGVRESVFPAATDFSGAVTVSRVTGWKTITRYFWDTEGSALLVTVITVWPACIGCRVVPLTLTTSSLSTVTSTFLFFVFFGRTVTASFVAFFVRTRTTGSVSVPSGAVSPSACTKASSGVLTGVTSNVIVALSSASAAVQLHSIISASRETRIFFIPLTSFMVPVSAAWIHRRTEMILCCALQEQYIRKPEKRKEFFFSFVAALFLVFCWTFAGSGGIFCFCPVRKARQKGSLCDE